jgi:hypothetical protein
MGILLKDKTKDKDNMLADGLERKINGQNPQGHGERKKSHGATVPDGALLMANEVGNNAGDETNRSGDDEAVNPRKKRRMPHSSDPFRGTVRNWKDSSASGAECKGGVGGWSGRVKN